MCIRVAGKASIRRRELIEAWIVGDSGNRKDARATTTAAMKRTWPMRACGNLVANARASEETVLTKGTRR